MSRLGDQITHLEHETQIAPIGSDPNHCQRCACAADGHTDDVEVSLMMCGGPDIIRTWCGTCGASLYGGAA